MEDIGLRKGAWTREEDTLLKICVDKFGQGKWHLVPSRAGLNRCRKSCRLRWMNYLKPDIKRGQFSADEVDLILRLHKLLGNRWSLIAGRIPGRTANDVKNYWNTYLKKKTSSNENVNATNKNSTNNHPSQKNSIQNYVVKPRPWTFKKKCLSLINDNSTITASQPVATNDMNLLSSSDHLQKLVSTMDETNFLWEIPFEDFPHNHEGNTNSLLTSYGFDISEPNLPLANLLNEAAELPGDLGISSSNNNSNHNNVGTIWDRQISVSDETKNYWTDFVLDMDISNLISEDGK